MIYYKTTLKGGSVNVYETLSEQKKMLAGETVTNPKGQRSSHATWTIKTFYASFETAAAADTAKSGYSFI